MIVYMYVKILKVHLTLWQWCFIKNSVKAGKVFLLKSLNAEYFACFFASSA